MMTLVNDTSTVIVCVQVYREVDVMKLVSHPNIVKLYQVREASLGLIIYFFLETFQMVRGGGFQANFIFSIEN